ncbi:MAG TPA: hypothetical protein VEQ59_12030 [Polyangiaceae bacterium]|nr:hypothetical protein [Polyangiaceae bacterium]
MRDALLSLGFVVVSACSLDHVVVATLEDTGASAASAGAAGSSSASRAGSAGALVSAGSAGTPAAAGVSAEAGRASIASGGSAERGMLPNPGGAGGSSAVLLCSCLDQQLSVCGSDGVTYPTECSDAGPCFPPAIACWHACPCLDAELDAGAAGVTTSWFSPECVSDNPCPSDFVCMTFSNVDREAQTICSTAN